MRPTTIHSEHLLFNSSRLVVELLIQIPVDYRLVGGGEVVFAELAWEDPADFLEGEGLGFARRDRGDEESVEGGLSVVVGDEWGLACVDVDFESERVASELTHGFLDGLFRVGSP